jgi:predicted membrane-bound dolichyl-phosphate-mannose-protein mannosyltransferase
VDVEIKRVLSRIYRWEYIWLCLLVVATLAMHFIIITNPAEPLFDEQHYVNDARNIIEKQETLRPEHPPLAKLFIVAGIKLFGDNPWGWRFFSVIFGEAGIVLFYFLCRRLNMSRTATSIATFLLALENMTFVQASIAMLDVYYFTFMVASFLLYACRRYISSGVAVGLSALAKLNGALALPAIFIHWLFTRQGRSRWFGLTVLLAPLAFVELMLLFDFAIVQRLSALIDPIHRIGTMLSLSSSLTFTNVEHPALSRPWEWLLSYKPMAYWITPHYTGAISFSIWALIIPTFAYMVYRAVRGNEGGLFGAAWFASTYLVWIPISIITNRVSYIYYFYPAIGAVCLGLGLGLSQLLTIYQEKKSGKLKWAALGIVTFYLLIHVASFVILSPVFPIPYESLLAIIS